MPDRNAELTILSRDADLLKNEINALNCNALRIVQCATRADDIDTDKVHILLADPDLAVKVVEQCHQLRWCQSTWAGNKPLLQLAKQDYTLTGVRGYLAKRCVSMCLPICFISAGISIPSGHLRVRRNNTAGCNLRRAHFTAPR